MTDRHDIALADKNVRLAELQADAARQELCGSQHDEQPAFVQLQLRALMRGQGIFDGQIVQAESL